MKKKTLMLIVLIVTLLIGLKNVFAKEVTCVYKGEWKTDRWSGEANVSIIIDTTIESQKGDPTFKAQVYVEDVSNNQYQIIDIVNYYAGYGTGFKNYYGDGSYTLAEYYYKTKTCPKYMTIFDWYDANNGLTTLLHSHMQYEFIDHEYKIAAELENINPNVDESLDNPTKKCDYIFKYNKGNNTGTASYYFLNSEVQSSLYVKLINKDDFNKDDCLEKVFVCMDPLGDPNGYVNTYFLAKDDATMYGENGIFRLKYDISPQEPSWLAQSSIECGYTTLDETNNNQLGNSGCTVIDLPIYRMRHKDGYYSDTYYRDQVSSFCTAYVSQNNYNGDQCLQECLNLDELYPDLFAAEPSNECSLTDDIIAWVENILRWVKYLVPIALIALSIVEFIKALSSEKEDDMKKAQKHFVTRLIVAVLIFLFPLLIEFVLDKMGFDATNCGIKNIGF